MCMLSAIYGMLLGDGCIYQNNGTFRLIVGHSIKQLSYLEWKKSLLGCRSETRPYQSGYGSPCCKFTFTNKKLLEEVYHTCVVDGKKTVTKKWLKHLDDLSLAIWYQDDGSFGKSGKSCYNGGRTQRYVRLHTGGFDPDSVKLLISWLKDHKDIDGTLFWDKQKYPTILLRHENITKLWNIVAPHIILLHKLDLGIKPCVCRCNCGEWIDYRSRVCLFCAQKRAQEFNRSFLWKNFGTSSIPQIKTLKIEKVKRVIHWFDHSRLRLPLPAS